MSVRSAATASARSVPPRTCDRLNGTVSIMKDTWPAIRSVTAGVEPRYGTWTASMPVTSLNCSVAMCAELPRPLRGVGQRAGLRLRGGDQLLHRMDRRVLRHQQQVRRLADQRDGGEILARIVGQLRIHDRPDRHVGRMAHDQGVTVGRGLGHQVGADRAGRDRVVLHEHRLAAAFLELGSIGAREQVDQPPGAAPTRIRIGLVGKCCVWPGTAVAINAAIARDTTVRRGCCILLLRLRTI